MPPSPARKFSRRIIPVSLLLGGSRNSRTVTQGTTHPQQPLKHLSIEPLGGLDVTTQSKAPEQIWKTPAATYGITQEDIKLSGSARVAEALRLASGGEVARIDSSTWAFGIRGFGTDVSRSVLVLMDGPSVYSTFRATTGHRYEPNVGDLGDTFDLDFGRASQSRKLETTTVLSFTPTMRADEPLLVSHAAAQESKPQEYQVKAVYLYNFGRFIDWPAAAAKDDSFAICVLGEDPFGRALDATVAGEKIGNRGLITRHVATEHDASGCRILFISSSEAAHVKDILESLSNSSILTVSDMAGFTSDGGMIQFVLKENRVRFEVNLTRAEKAGLIFSSQLLKVASDVRREPGDSRATQ